MLTGLEAAVAEMAIAVLLVGVTDALFKQGHVQAMRAGLDLKITPIVDLAAIHPFGHQVVGALFLRTDPGLAGIGLGHGASAGREQARQAQGGNQQ